MGRYLSELSRSMNIYLLGLCAARTRRFDFCDAMIAPMVYYGGNKEDGTQSSHRCV